MNSNPFPAAFVNFKGELQVWPVTIPANGAQCFVEWRMDLLTELHAVELMTNSMNNIMALSLNSKLPVLSIIHHERSVMVQGTIVNYAVCTVTS